MDTLVVGQFKIRKKVRSIEPDSIEIGNQQLNTLFPSRRIEKVLFIVPPDADGSMFNYESGKRGRYWNYPPYGVGILARYVQKDGITVEILNLNNEIL
mgnify:CR=1 FL=1|jgi:hypothetical protein|tara:strand:- start:602 stop:895 length:294 start_codon:yes stop_codon:yes gene_type:complete